MRLTRSAHRLQRCQLPVIACGDKVEGLEAGALALQGAVIVASLRRPLQGSGRDRSRCVPTCQGASLTICMQIPEIHLAPSSPLRLSSNFTAHYQTMMRSSACRGFGLWSPAEKKKSAFWAGFHVIPKAPKTEAARSVPPVTQLDSAAPARQHQLSAHHTAPHRTLASRHGHGVMVW